MNGLRIASRFLFLSASPALDLDQYHAVLAWAAARGLCVADSVKLYLQFGAPARSRANCGLSTS